MTGFAGGRRLIEKPSGIPDFLWSVCFFLLMLSVICFGGKNEGLDYYYYFTFFLFVGYSGLLFLFRIGRTMRLYLPMHTVWYGLFLLLAILSGIWADSLSYTMVPISKMTQILVVTGCLILYVDSREKLERYIYTVMAATLFMTVYIYARTPRAKWFNGYLGTVTRFNTNDVGCALSVMVLFAFYEAYVHKKRGAYAIAAIAFLTAVLTSSRKALLMCISGILLIVVFNYRARNYILRVLIILAGLASVLVLVYQIPYLYNAVGWRLNKMIEFVMNDDTSDHSLVLRKFYIDMAQTFFEENPLVGIGMNNFSYRIRDYGSAIAYAHNNYMEIAADLGIVGLVTYYWFYVYLLWKLFKQVLDGHKNALLFLSMMILFMVFEYGMVNYYKMQVQMGIAISYAVVVMNDRADTANYLRSAVRRAKRKESEEHA